MRYFDVFNGDADGICALHQLRLADPVDSTVVTGLKRDNALLASVPAGEGDVVTVLDLPLTRNREALDQLLERGAVVHYFDHHFAGPIPSHPRLLAMIDESGATCTSSLIDRYLRGRYRIWAVVGAFGDNLDDTAVELARTLEIDAQRLEQLRELGTNVNYGAYGRDEADVLMPPAEVYRVVSHYADPFELAAREPLFERLAEERRDDIERALAGRPVRATRSADAWVLPDAAWSRRVSGTFANRLALLQPHRAHAVLTSLAGGGYVVSLRAPRGKGPSAVEFCRHFPTGGGRAAAAGIDRLESSGLDAFLEAFGETWDAAAASAAEA
jgi:hypothetical protein